MIGIDRTLLHLLSVSRSMSLGTLVRVLIAKEKDYKLNWTYKRHIAQSNWIVAQCNSNNKEFKSFEEMYDILISNGKEDTRSAEEIIKETYAKFGVEV